MGNLISWWEGRFSIYVKTHGGNVIRMEVKDSETLYMLKSRIQEIDGCPTDQMRLIFDSKALEGNRCLSDYGIQHESTIYMTLRLRGGWLPSEDDHMGDKKGSMEELADF